MDLLLRDWGGALNSRGFLLIKKYAYFYKTQSLKLASEQNPGPMWFCFPLKGWAVASQTRVLDAASAKRLIPCLFLWHHSLISVLWALGLACYREVIWPCGFCCSRLKDVHKDPVRNGWWGLTGHALPGGIPGSAMILFTVPIFQFLEVSHLGWLVWVLGCKFLEPLRPHWETLLTHLQARENQVLGAIHRHGH